MKSTKTRLYNQLLGESDSLESLPGSISSRSSGVGAEIGQIVGNPAFKAEITLQVSVRYYSQAVVGTPAVAVPAAAQQNGLPLYLLGNNDYLSNYGYARQMVPGGGGFNYADMAMINVGSGETGYFPLPHAAGSVKYASGTIFNSIAANGDLLFLIPMTGFVAGAAATTHTAEILIHCPNVPYTKLLASLQSDIVTINMIRYTVPAAAVAQFGTQVSLLKQSLFGKAAADSLDPQTFITPGTFQPQICDMPVTITVDKNFGFATQILYTAVVPITLNWTLTISNTQKISA